MSATMTVDDVRSSSDVDALWATFTSARQDGDAQLADAARVRMAELQQEQALDATEDDQLVARAAAVRSALEEDDSDERRAELDALRVEAERRGIPI